MNKVFDCFTFNGELDILDIRLNILDPYVDWFILGESKQTFSGKDKPLYYHENKDRFAKWNHKILFGITGNIETNNAFERAAFQKDRLRRGLSELGARPEDIIIYGDVDEIANPKIIKEEKEGKLRQFNYSYFLNNRSSEVWEGTNVFKYKNIRDLNDIRADHSVILENGGWHFTNCMSHDKILNKIESYDHQEANVPFVKDNLKYRIEQNQDFLGRSHDWKGNPFTMWIDDKDLPDYILKNKAKYKHLWK